VSVVVKCEVKDQHRPSSIRYRFLKLLPSEFKLEELWPNSLFFVELDNAF